MKIKKIKPMFTGILTTAKKYSESIFIPGSSLVDPSKGKETLQEYQKVISVGPSVTEIKRVTPSSNWSATLWFDMAEYPI